MPVVINLKEYLSVEEIERAEKLAKAHGMTLDEWLVSVFRKMIRREEVRLCPPPKP